MHSILRCSLISVALILTAWRTAASILVHSSCSRKDPLVRPAPRDQLARPARQAQPVRPELLVARVILAPLVQPGLREPMDQLARPARLVPLARRGPRAIPVKASTSPARGWMRLNIIQMMS